MNWHKKIFLRSFLFSFCSILIIIFTGAISNARTSLNISDNAGKVIKRASISAGEKKTHNSPFQISKQLQSSEELKQTDWWTKVQENIKKREYHITALKKPSHLDTKGTFQAPNRAQNFRTYFTPKSIRVARRTEKDPTWSLELNLQAVVRDGKVTTLPTETTPIVAGPRVEYHRGSVVEWYENRPEGLEQGFTLNQRPSGKGNLKLFLHVKGSVRPTLFDNNNRIDFLTESNVRVLTYSNLQVFDIRGKALSSWFEIVNNDVTIVVDDHEAVYPVVIDPLLSAPSWTVESNKTWAQFGASVSTAGDVNGDGFSDVIVGAPYFSNSYTFEGTVFVFYGSASGLSSTPDWIAEGNQASALLGNSVSTAGDVNGDGFSDVIVGAPGYQNDETREGKVFVYYGSTTGLSAAADWTAQGNPWAEFGASVSTAGDVNGDGFSDIIVGAPDEGAAFVYYGSSSGLSSTANWSAEVYQDRASNIEAPGLFGSSVSTAGDVNGDGFSDVIVGAGGIDNGQADEGKVFLYYGSATGLSATPNWTVEGNQNGAGLGRSVSTAGDLNGDGFGDLIISSSIGTFIYFGSIYGPTKANWNGPSSLHVSTAGDVNGDGFSDVSVGGYVYYGSSSGPSNVADWTAAGSFISAAGDANGDGFGDVIVGDPFYSNGQENEGAAFVYYGSSSGPSTTLDWTAEGNKASSFFGISASTAGDVNGDGFNDVIVGAYWYDNGQTHEGKAFVYYGSSSGLSATANWTFEGNQAYAQLGWSVSTAGDVNGDGFSDVVIGADYYDNDQTNEGAVFVFYGSASGLSSTPDWIAEGNQDGRGLGYFVSTAGDVNGDGFSDIIVADGSRVTDRGKAYVYYGSASGLSAVADWAHAAAVNGIRIASAGDVNGDGYSDIIIGSFRQNDYGGIVYVYYGSKSGLSATADWIAVDDQISENFGRSISTAGDINGDGFSDIIIGAPFYDNTQIMAGKVFVYYGSSSGLSATANWTVEGNQAYAQLGWSVSTAGDVNGDGFSDIIIGANLYTNGQSDEGRALVYYGSASGLSTIPAWTAESNQATAYFGDLVSTAGDVNGDGFSDIIVGASWYDNGQTDEGKVFVYYGNKGDNIGFKVRQLTVDGLIPIAQLGRSDSENSFIISLTLDRNPMPNSKFQLEWEVKLTGAPFDGMGTHISSEWHDMETSPYTFPEEVTGLIGHTAYHWRARLRYPAGNPMGQVAGRWYYPFPANTNVTDFRTNNGAPSGGFTVDNIIPVSQISQPTLENESGIITINFRIKDAGINECTLHTFQYSVDSGANWKMPTNGDGSGSLDGGWPDNGGTKYSSSPGWSGDIHSFTLNTKHNDVAADFSGVDQSDVRIRFKLNDGLDDSAAYATSENFRVDHVPPTVGTIFINDNSGTTSDATPNLTLSAVGAHYMRFALSESGLSSAVWVPYATSYSAFDISEGGNGTKTIWVEFRDEFFNIQASHASDSTNWDTSPVVTSASSVTNDSSPTWTWTSNGGTGTYRVNEDSKPWLTPTTDTSYTGFLPDGFHTLYVQEEISADSWSFSGSFEIEIDNGDPCSQADTLSFDDQTGAYTITYTYDDVYADDPQCGQAASGSGVAQVKLHIIKPGGEEVVFTHNEAELGNNFTFNPPDHPPASEGRYDFYTVAVDHAGNVELAPENPDLSTFYSKDFPGYAIIAVGSLSNQEGLPSHTKTANGIYAHLINRNFALIDPLDATDNSDPYDQIKYFNPDTSENWGEDPINGNYKQALQNAVRVWAKEKMQIRPGPLYLILINHGEENKFYTNNGEYIEDFELARWLDGLESDMGALWDPEITPFIIIIGTCQSGSFFDIDDPQDSERTLSKMGRIIIASSAADEASYRGGQEPGLVPIRDGEYFTTALFDELASGFDLKTSFKRAALKTKVHTDSGTGQITPYLDTARQHPHLDDNGDKLGSHELIAGGDGDFAAKINLGSGIHDVEPLVVADISKPVEPLSSGEIEVTSATLSVKVSPQSEVSRVWMEVRSPETILNEAEYPWQQQAADLDEKLMPLTGDRYEALYNNFTIQGRYTVFFYARDNRNIIWPIGKTFVYKAKPANSPPENFSLLSPADGISFNAVAGVGFSWEVSIDPETDPVTYTLEIRSGSSWENGKTFYMKEGITENIWISGTELTFINGQSYYWQVTAVDQYGAKAQSTVQSFTVNNQNSSSGWIRGIVKNNQTLQPIPSAKLISETGILMISTIGDGSYLVTGPVGGPYGIQISADGYQEINFSDIQIINLPISGEVPVRDFYLPPTMLKGNINGVNTVDLADAILASQLLVGIQPSVPAFKEADVNGDGKVGLEEVVYILQKVSELR